MSFVASFRSKIDERRVRIVFPEMTDSETPVWVGSPCFFSMSGHYALALVVLMIHLVFFWAAEGPTVESEGGLVYVIGALKSVLDVSGVLGFIVVLFALAKINHYLNLSTSNKWTTTWLILNGAIPLLTVLADFSGKVLATYTEDVIYVPQWLQVYYLALGILSSGSMIVLTILYQRAFQYAITDRRIYIRKQFLYFDTSAHGISFGNIENLKVDPSIIGRVLGFGNVHVVTASGIGLREDETGIGAGLAASAESILTERGRGLVHSVFGWVSAQRQRTTVDQDPEDCLYGVRDPLALYRLINEMSDRIPVS